METDLLADIEKPCTVMVVLPHPDDESFATGGVLALYARDPDIKTVTLCLSKGGRSGALLKVGLPEEREPFIREQEYRTATAILGVDRAIIWEYMDQDVDKVDQEELKNKIIETIRECRADVIITYGPEGITGHPDHVACSRITREAAGEAGAKRLYMVSAPRIMARLVIRQDLLPPTHAINIRKTYPVKILALKAHASQMLISMQPMIWVGVLMRMYGKEYYHRVF
jgi:LmbE family N-acetylglucosaminyl deacetylase